MKTRIANLTTLTLPSKCQGKDFNMFLPYKGLVVILVMWLGLFEHMFVPPAPGGYIYKIWLQVAWAFEEFFKMVILNFFGGFIGPLRQYFSLYRALPKRGRKRTERIDESKNVQTTPIRTYCKRSKPLAYWNPNCRTPRHWKFTQHHRTTRPPTVILKKSWVKGQTSTLTSSTHKSSCSH